MHYTNNTPYEIALNISIHRCFWIYNATRFALKKDAIVADIDLSGNSKAISHFLALFGKYKPTRPHNAMSFFASRTVWFVKDNLFGRIFVSGLTSMVESGIYWLWHRNLRFAIYVIDSYIRIWRRIKESQRIENTFQYIAWIKRRRRWIHDIGSSSGSLCPLFRHASSCNDNFCRWTYSKTDKNTAG